MKFNETKNRKTSEELERRSFKSSRLSVLNENRSEITYLSINQLYPYKKQARRIFENSEIETLAATIREHGIRQPLTVLRVEGDAVYFEVISGERRLRAAKILGMEKVPCIIIENEEKAEEIALVENIQRQDLHPLELADALNVLINKIGRGGQTALEKKLGISQSKISELLKLLELPVSVKEELLKLNYRGRDNLRKLVALRNEQEQVKFLKLSEKISTSVRKKNESIFRILIRGEKIEIQKKSLNNLSVDQKSKLKKLLHEFLSSI